MLFALRDMRSRICTKHSTLTAAGHAMTRGEIRKCDDVLFLSRSCFVFHARGHVHAACHVCVRDNAERDRAKTAVIQRCARKELERRIWSAS